MEEILEQFTRVEFAPGDVIAFENNLSDGLYLLEEGIIDVIKDDEVVAQIKEKNSFFGEMSYLMKRRRTATLKAHNHVKAILINAKRSSADKQSEQSTVAETSLEMMRILASRLDMANQEIKRLEGYESFHQECYDLAYGEGNNTLKDALVKIDNKVRVKETNKGYKLIQEYLMTPKIWNQLKDSVIEVILFYTQQPLKVNNITAYKEGEFPIEFASFIGIHGEKSGNLILNMSEDLATDVTKAFGVNDFSKEMIREAVMEVSNQVLGKLKAIVNEYDINLQTPKALGNKDELTELLGDSPALLLNMECEIGTLDLIYQITRLSDSQ
ncbi:MAG: chemotaxis protein CheX [Planctomycetes bacterium]|nr:chemotaxis protein CheX [Planctomycetota bacterium]